MSRCFGLDTSKVRLKKLTKITKITMKEGDKLIAIDPCVIKQSSRAVIRWHWLLVECSIGIQNLFLFFFEGGKFKN